MKVRITLSRGGWSLAKGNVFEAFAVGRAFCKTELQEAHELSRFLVSTFEDGGREAVTKLVESLNGYWSVVLKFPDSVFCAVDHIRSHQLMYGVVGEEVCVFDDVEDFRSKHHLEFDEDSVQEYLSSGFVYGGRTLFKGVDSLQAGEMAWLTDRGVERKRYYRFHAIRSDEPLPKNLDDEANNVFLRVFERTLKVVDGRKIAVPLSGGCDSRLIVSYLHRLNYKNVVCFSYGFPNNREAVKAKQVAERLGYPWHFIEYDKGLREREIYDFSDAVHNRYMCNGVNRPVKQDFFSIKQLLAKGVLVQNDVLMPGYCFDVVAGSFLQKNLYSWSVCAELYGHDCNFWSYGVWKKILARIRRVADENKEIGRLLFWETFLWQERLVKFAAHNVHTYEPFGLDWYLPLWDRELLDFWMRLPDKMRMGRAYFYRIFDQLCEPSIRDVPYYNIHASSSDSSVLKHLDEVVRDRIPELVKHHLRVIRSALHISPSVMVDSNPQSGPVGMRTDVRDRLLRSLPGMNIKERLMRTHETSRGAYEAMVTLLQMVEK